LTPSLTNFLVKVFMSAKRKRSNALSIYADEIVSSPPYPSPTSSRKKTKNTTTESTIDNN